jgi:hypothetical protein
MPIPFTFKGVPSIKKEFGRSVSEVCFPCYTPGVIDANSEKDEDIVRSYETGASSYIPKQKVPGAKERTGCRNDSGRGLALAVRVSERHWSFF